MAHETNHNIHHSDAHADHHHHVEIETRPTTSYWSAFWFVLILVGLFVAAVNFVGVMGEGEGHAPLHETKEASASQTFEGETGRGIDAYKTTQHAAPRATADSPKVEGHEQAETHGAEHH